MKLDHIRMLPEATVVFTKEEATSLIESAKHHYDWKCQDLVLHGALRAFANLMKNFPDEPLEYRFDMSDIDLLNKVAESPRAMPSLYEDLHKIFKVMDEAYRKANS